MQCIKICSGKKRSSFLSPKNCEGVWIKINLPCYKRVFLNVSCEVCRLPVLMLDCSDLYILSEGWALAPNKPSRLSPLKENGPKIATKFSNCLEIPHTSPYHHGQQFSFTFLFFIRGSATLRRNYRPLIVAKGFLESRWMRPYTNLLCSQKVQITHTQGGWKYTKLNWWCHWEQM